MCWGHRFDTVHWNSSNILFVDIAKKRTILFAAVKGNMSPAVWKLPNQCRSNNQQADPNESQGNPVKGKGMQMFSWIVGVKENNLKLHK